MARATRYVLTVTGPSYREESTFSRRPDALKAAARIAREWSTVESVVLIDTYAAWRGPDVSTLFSFHRKSAAESARVEAERVAAAQAAQAAQAERDADQAEREAARADSMAQVMRYGPVTLYFTATHVCPDYRFTREPVRVNATPDYGVGVAYYASHSRLGCGKNAVTPRAAVLSLVSDHACNVHIIEHEDGTPVSIYPPLTPLQEESLARIEAESAERVAAQAENKARDAARAAEIQDTARLTLNGVCVEFDAQRYGREHEFRMRIQDGGPDKFRAYGTAEHDGRVYRFCVHHGFDGKRDAVIRLDGRLVRESAKRGVRYAVLEAYRLAFYTSATTGETGRGMRAAMACAEAKGEREADKAAQARLDASAAVLGRPSGPEDDHMIFVMESGSAVDIFGHVSRAGVLALVASCPAYGPSATFHYRPRPDSACEDVTAEVLELAARSPAELESIMESESREHDGPDDSGPPSAVESFVVDSVTELPGILEDGEAAHILADTYREVTAEGGPDVAARRAAVSAVLDHWHSAARFTAHARQWAAQAWNYRHGMRTAALAALMCLPGGIASAADGLQVCTTPSAPFYTLDVLILSALESAGIDLPCNVLTGLMGGLVVLLIGGLLLSAVHWLTVARERRAIARLRLSRSYREAVSAELLRAYDRLADGNRVTNAEQFHAYGERYGVDTLALIQEARVRVAQQLAERAVRSALYSRSYR